MDWANVDRLEGLAGGQCMAAASAGVLAASEQIAAQVSPVAQPNAVPPLPPVDATGKAGAAAILQYLRKALMDRAMNVGTSGCLPSGWTLSTGPDDTAVGHRRGWTATL